MLSYTISTNWPEAKIKKYILQNLDNLKNGRTLEQGWALGNLPYYVVLASI